MQPKRSRSWNWVWAIVVAVGVGRAGLVEADPPAAPENKSEPDALQSLRVENSHKGGPFSYTIRPVSQNADYRVYRIEFPSPVESPYAQNNLVPADYYVPRNVTADSRPRPAAICLHILNGNFELVQMTCSLLASRGIPAIWLRLPYYGERSLPAGRRALLEDPSLFVESMPQGVADVRRTIDLLASRPEIDARRIGVTGISLGGILAATIAGVDDRVHRAVLILAGGDLPKIIATADETRELREVMQRLPEAQRNRLADQIAEVDPLRHAAGLRDRAKSGLVLMVNAAEDRVVPREATERLAKALGIADRVVWLDGLGHYTAMAALPQVMRRTASFFAADLPSEVAKKDRKTPADPSVAKPTPLDRLVIVVSQVAQLIGTIPGEGRCHYMDLAADVTLLDGSEHQGWLRFIRGHGYRFRLEAELPEVGRLALGQGNFPWMAAGDKVVFEGVDEPLETDDPLAFAAPEHLLKVRMASSALGAVALAPMALEQWVRVAETGADGQSVTLEIKSSDPGDTARVVLTLDAERSTPREVQFKVPRAKVSVAVRTWQLDTVAPDALFDRPPGPRAEAVSQRQLVRMFSAMFNFAMEHIR